MKNLQLPPAMAALRPELGNVVASIEAKAPYGSVWLSTRQGMQIGVNNREERVREIPPSSGTVLSAFDGVTVHEQAIGGFDRSGVQRGAKDLLASATFASKHPMDPGPKRQGDYVSFEDGKSLPPEEILERCRTLHGRIRGLDSRIVNIDVGYSEANEYSVFVNRAADLAQHVRRMRIFMLVTVAGENGVRVDFTGKSTTDGWDDLTFTDEELQKTVDQAIAQLTAERIEPGEYTIIAAPGVTGTICHESFGHGVETDMFLKERAKAAHYIDKVVGSSLVNIWEDPSYPGAHGSYFFDDEGMIAGPTQIVENGVFRRGITDMYSSTALNIPRSANGRRQDYSRKTYARMSNTFFAKGTTPVADLFAQVDNGIYLEKWSSGMEDPQGWGIQVTCQFGHEIKNGKITGRMFAPVAISGYVPDVLQSVSAVGDEWALEGGTCGKGHKEYVPVSSGGPHLLLKARLG